MLDYTLSVIFQERLKIKVKLLLSANRKSYMRRRLIGHNNAWPSVTLNGRFCIARYLCGRWASCLSLLAFNSLHIHTPINVWANVNLVTGSSVWLPIRTASGGSPAPMFWTLIHSRENTSIELIHMKDKVKILNDVDKLIKYKTLWHQVTCSHYDLRFNTQQHSINSLHSKHCVLVTVSLYL